MTAWVTTTGCKYESPVDSNEIYYCLALSSISSSLRRMDLKCYCQFRRREKKPILRDHYYHLNIYSRLWIIETRWWTCLVSIIRVFHLKGDKSYTYATRETSEWKRCCLLKTSTFSRLGHANRALGDNLNVWIWKETRSQFYTFDSAYVNLWNYCNALWCSSLEAAGFSKNISIIQFQKNLQESHHL